MASHQRGAAYTAGLEYYRIKFPVLADRIAAIKAAYITAYEAGQASIGSDLTSTGADGVSAAWTVNMSSAEVLAVTAEILQYLEGRASNRAQGRLC